MRVALVHDWLTGMRGGERVLHELVQLYPDADLHTLIHVPGTTTAEIDARVLRASSLSGLPGVGRHYRKLLPLFPWAIRRFDLRGYDLVISCSHAFAKSVRVRDGTPHLCYCLTPMRYVWDLPEAYLGHGPLRALASPLVAALRRFDRSTSTPGGVTRFVAISRAVRERIARHYGRESACVFPPVRTDLFVPGSPSGDAPYLMVAGFVPYKREDLAVEAFGRLGRPLVVAGDGPGRRRLERGAPPNVRFVGRVPDSELAELYAGCRALVYPQEEDFGLVAVEAQCAGRPVIAYGRGGAVDSVVDAKSDESPTGVLFTSQTVEGLVAAVERFERLEDRFDAAAIRARAERFGVGRFREEFRREVQLALSAAGRCDGS